MDVNMPELDGLETTRRIRQQESSTMARPTIIAMTANALPGDRETYLAAGMNNYISKPVHVNELVKALKRCSPISPQEPASMINSQNPVHVRPSAVDLTVLEEFQAMLGEEDLGTVPELIAIFLKDSPNLLGEIQSAISDADAKIIERATHTFKSSARHLGAIELGKLCEALETLARGGTLDQVPERVAEIVAEYDHVKIELEAELQKRRTPTWPCEIGLLKNA
jgi:HPt (histidine-containing phosphotransfer) domain-containing protein